VASAGYVGNSPLALVMAGDEGGSRETGESVRDHKIGKAVVS
jgi:hypothetical protein